MVELAIKRFELVETQISHGKRKSRWVKSLAVEGAWYRSANRMMQWGSTGIPQPKWHKHQHTPMR
jgi:hypothetical protein